MFLIVQFAISIWCLILQLAIAHVLGMVWRIRGLQNRPSSTATYASVSWSRLSLWGLIVRAPSMWGRLFRRRRWRLNAEFDTLESFGIQEYRDAQKKKKGQESRSSETMGNSLDTSKFTTLFQWLDSATSEAVVGLEQVDCSFLFLV